MASTVEILGYLFAAKLAWAVLNFLRKMFGSMGMLGTTDPKKLGRWAVGAASAGAGAGAAAAACYTAAVLVRFGSSSAPVARPALAPAPLRLPCPCPDPPALPLPRAASRRWLPSSAHPTVTGATDGIGKGVAMQLAKRGVSVILVSRTQSRLDDTAAEIKATTQPTCRCCDARCISSLFLGDCL